MINKKRVNIPLILIILFYAFFSIARGADEKRIFFYYEKRIPLFIQLGWGVHGLFGDPIKRYFENAEIPIVFDEVPFNRSLKMIKEDDKLACMVISKGEKIGGKTVLLSDVFYLEKNIVAVTRYDNVKIERKEKLKDVLQNQQLTFVKKKGTSSGKKLDNMIFKYKPKEIALVGGTLRILNFVHKGRADYFFMAEKEAKTLISFSGISLKKFKFVHFEEKIPGKSYHIACSKNMPKEYLRKINAAISSDPGLK